MDNTTPSDNAFMTMLNNPTINPSPRSQGAVATVPVGDGVSVPDFIGPMTTIQQNAFNVLKEAVQGAILISESDQPVEVMYLGKTPSSLSQSLPTNKELIDILGRLTGDEDAGSKVNDPLEPAYEIEVFEDVSKVLHASDPGMGKVLEALKQVFGGINGNEKKNLAAYRIVVEGEAMVQIWVVGILDGGLLALASVSIET